MSFEFFSEHDIDTVFLNTLLSFLIIPLLLQVHRITESQNVWGWEGPLWVHLVQSPCQSRVT